MNGSGWNKKELGAWGESLAVNYLEQAGLKIVRRNYRCPKGEMDIIARDQNWLVFVEVRTRTSAWRGTAEESLDPRKMAKLRAVASYYLLENGYDQWPEVRMDLIAIYSQEEDYSVNWLKGL